MFGGKAMMSAWSSPPLPGPVITTPVVGSSRPSFGLLACFSYTVPSCPPDLGGGPFSQGATRVLLAWFGLVRPMSRLAF